MNILCNHPSKVTISQALWKLEASLTRKDSEYPCDLLCFSSSSVSLFATSLNPNGTISIQSDMAIPLRAQTTQTPILLISHAAVRRTVDTVVRVILLSAGCNTLIWARALQVTLLTTKNFASQWVFPEKLVSRVEESWMVVGKLDGLAQLFYQHRSWKHRTPSES